MISVYKQLWGLIQKFNPNFIIIIIIIIKNYRLVCFLLI